MNLPQKHRAAIAIAAALLLLPAAARAQDPAPPATPAAPSVETAVPALEITGNPTGINVPGKQTGKSKFDSDTFLTGKIHLSQPPQAEYIVEYYFICTGPDGNGHYILNSSLDYFKRPDYEFKQTCRLLYQDVKTFLDILAAPSANLGGDDFFKKNAAPSGGSGAPAAHSADAGLQRVQIPKKCIYEGWIIRVSSGRKVLLIASDPPSLAAIAAAHPNILHLRSAQTSRNSELP